MPAKSRPNRLQHDADSAAQTMVGTAAYLAPEVVRWSEHYDAKVRQWALAQLQARVSQRLHKQPACYLVAQAPMHRHPGILLLCQLQRSPVALSLPTQTLPLAGHHLQKVDVWGAGIVLYALLYGQLPFEPSRPDIFAEHDERRRPPPEGRQVGSLFVGLVVWLLVG